MRPAYAVLVLGLMLWACDGGEQIGAPTSPNAPSNPNTPVPAAPTDSSLFDHAPEVRVGLNPSPPSGPAPLTLQVNLCRSGDLEKEPLSFFYGFGKGEGASESDSCRAQHVYNVPGRYRAIFCVKDLSQQTCTDVIVHVM